MFVRFHGTRTVEGPFNDQGLATLVRDGLLDERDEIGHAAEGPFIAISDSKDKRFSAVRDAAFMEDRVAGVRTRSFRWVAVPLIVALLSGLGLLAEAAWAALSPAKFDATRGVMLGLACSPLVLIAWFGMRLWRERRRTRRRLERTLVAIACLMFAALLAVIVMVAIRP